MSKKWLYCQEPLELLFTENGTNNERLFGVSNASPYVKDGINDYIVHGRKEAVNPNQTGTKAVAHYLLTIGAGETQTVYLRLSKTPYLNPFGDEFKTIFQTRQREADEFYQRITPVSLSEDMRNIQRHAFTWLTDKTLLLSTP